MLGEPWLAALLRWGIFLALLTAIGAAAFAIVVLSAVRRRALATPAEDTPLPSSALARIERRAAGFGLLGVLALFPLAAARLQVQVAQLRDPSEPWIGPASMMLLETPWGWGWWLQVGAALLAAIGFGLARTDAGRRAGWALAALAIVALAITPGLSGHAIGAPRFVALAVTADAFHVLGGGAWLGTLTILFLCVLGPREVSVAAVKHFVESFSPLALVAAGLVVASGVVGAWLHLGALPALWETVYGRWLLAKVALFGIIAGFGAWNWRRVTPQLATSEGAAALRRSSRGELVTAIVLLAVTAILVATPLPGE